ncbi:MAG: methyltransferase domain-containing protein [Chloroflexia bacterium]
MDRAEVEAELALRIEPWLQHMRWRRDFAAWRERRLFQERYQEGRLAQVRRCLGTLAGKRLLDLGAGMGGFAVAATREGAVVYAAEFNAAYCEISVLRGKRYGLALPVLQAAGEALPFPEGFFDAVCAWDVLEHVRHPARVLAESHRVLRPGGVFLLTVVNRLAFRDPHYHLPLLNWVPRAWAEWWVRRAARGKEQVRFADRQRLSEMHYFTWGAFRHLARAAGFRVQDLREGGSEPGRHTRYARLRRLLRLVGLERPAYRLARSLFLSSFEVALWKESVSPSTTSPRP